MSKKGKVEEATKSNPKLAKKQVSESEEESEVEV
jgi:hypothetical protein